jgi:carboxymethylenebutenolidase
MGESIAFPGQGGERHGYLATPPRGQGRGVLVVSEYWGLVPHITDVCDRLAGEGFVALAPDLLTSRVTTDPEQAGEWMMAMNPSEAAADLSAAVDAVGSRSDARGVGVVGFCMGGGLAYVVAAARPDAVRAVVPFYGAIPWPGAEPDYAAITGAVLGHYAANDRWATPQLSREIERRIRAGGNTDVTIHVYPGTEHAFFNDTRPEVYAAAAAALAWERTVAFLRDRLSRGD